MVLAPILSWVYLTLRGVSTDMQSFFGGAGKRSILKLGTKGNAIDRIGLFLRLTAANQKGFCEVHTFIARRNFVELP
jgi:hypothetical protein